MQKLNGTIYSADQIIGKSLYMNPGKTINLRNYPSTENGIILAVAKSTEFVGIVYSYVVRPDGIWWQIQRGSIICWAKHLEGYFDVKALAGQGALTPEEIAERKAEAEKSLLEKTVDKTFALIKTGVFIFLGYQIVSSLLFSKNG